MNYLEGKNIFLYPDQLKAIVVPSGALGSEAVLASMERGVHIISVKNSSALNVCNRYMNFQNLTEVSNYFEAAGLLLSIREGINPKSIKRPIIPFAQSSIS